MTGGTPAVVAKEPATTAEEDESTAADALDDELVQNIGSSWARHTFLWAE